jgi:RNA-splicing ligase RtcB
MGGERPGKRSSEVTSNGRCAASSSIDGGLRWSEEAPAVYRDIHEVLDAEADLVRPVLRLEPIAVFKGR